MKGSARAEKRRAHAAFASFKAFNTQSRTTSSQLSWRGLRLCFSSPPGRQFHIKLACF